MADLEELEEFAVTATLTLSYRVVVKARSQDEARGVAASVAADFVADSSDTRRVQWETHVEPDRLSAWSPTSVDFVVEQVGEDDYVVLDVASTTLADA